MARTDIPVTDLTAESASAVVLASAGVALDPTDDHIITPGGDVRELLLFVSHTTASAKKVTVVAGANPPAVRNGAGDLEESFADGSTTAVNKLIPLTSSRFMQADGSIHVDVEAGTTGRIACFRVPRSE